MEAIRLRSIAIGFVIFLLSVVISAVVLNFQADPFIAYTMVMAKLISELGSSGQASQYLSTLRYFGWQGMTYDVLQGMYGAGMLLAILHLISGSSISQLTYLPVPGMLSMCMVYLILRRLSKVLDRTLKSANLVFRLVAIASMYSYMLQYEMGRSYAFDFHGINNALYLMCLYFIIGLICEPKSSYFLAFIMAFTASNIIHYNVPVVVIGDLAAYLVFSWLVLRVTKMPRLIMLLVIISSLQSFYFTILSGVNVQQVLSDLIQYFSGGFLEFAPAQGVAWPFPYQYQQILFAKAYTYSAIIFVIVISLALFRTRGGRKLTPIDTAYSIVVGGGVIYFVAYFANYGHGAFGFVDGWLLQPLLFAPIAMIWAGQKLETTTQDKRSTAFEGSDGQGLGNRRQVVRKLALATLLVLALLLAGSTTLAANGNLFYGPAVSDPGMESASLQSFAIRNLSGGHFLIGASIEVSSSLFGHLTDYSKDKVFTVIPVPMMGYSTLANNTLGTYTRLRHDFDYLILTKYELTNGLNGNVLPDYINATEVNNLKAVLDSNQNLVCNSGQAYLYLLD